jgi:hypothetical protein
MYRSRFNWRRFWPAEIPDGRDVDVVHEMNAGSRE